MVPDYSPRGIGRIVDDAITLYRAEFRTIASAAAYVLLPLALVASIAQIFYTRSAFASIRTPGFIAQDQSLAQTYSMFASYALWLLGLMAFGLASLYFASAVWNAAPALISRQPMKPGEFLRGGASRFGWVLLVSMIVYLVYTVGSVASVFGTFLFVLPGVGFLVATIVAMVHLSMAVPIVVLERASLDGALRRSVALVRRNGWRTVGFWVGTSLIIYALQAGIGSFGSAGSILSIAQTGGFNVGLPWQILAGVLQGVGQALAQPLLYVAWMLYYLDLRARTEGIDLLVRAQALTPATR